MQTPSDVGVRDVIVLAAVRQHEIDGIYDYTRHLAHNLEACDAVEVVIRNPRLASVDQLVELLPASAGGTLTVALQYNPFSFGRWGFAPWLPVKLWRLKRISPRLRLGLTVHELYFPITSWRSAMIGVWQRVQFFAVLVLADIVFTSITEWASDLANRRPARPVYHLPVGSNLPDMRHTREAERERLGADEETVVLAAFGANHPSRLMEHVSRAAAMVASGGSRTLLVNLGSDVPPLDAGPAVEVLTPGQLSAEQIARHLAAADIYLAPFIDGVSTRRTTVMAALQHGLPVIGTDGHLTDAVLRRATNALTLTPVADVDAFARAATALARDDAARSRHGAVARSLYEHEFDWPVISARLVAALRERDVSRCV